MTKEEAARILDPATSAEALRPYALDCVMRMAVVEEACRNWSRRAGEKDKRENLD